MIVLLLNVSFGRYRLAVAGKDAGWEGRDSAVQSGREPGMAQMTVERAVATAPPGRAHPWSAPLGFEPAACCGFFYAPNQVFGPQNISRRNCFQGAAILTNRRFWNLSLAGSKLPDWLLSW